MTLVDEAKQVAPRLAESAAEDKRLRRLADITWKILLDNGFLRSLQPARWGGGEVSLMEFVDATMQLAQVSLFATL
jgi:3-hydroxy-9,10-secoandrosta-1,3,5(10)-triene-9,17-dione monooxygenase